MSHRNLVVGPGELTLRPRDLLRVWIGGASRAVRSLAEAGPGGLGRVAALLVVVPLIALLQLVHWLGFLLDEILFPSYRKVQVREPLFVVGMPRSGTTLLHRTLAEDERFATPSLWELVLAPSVTERRIFAWLGRVDRLLGGYGRRAVGRIERLLSSRMVDIHPVGLEAPGEDFLWLLPAWACFLLVIAFPRSEVVWALTEIDAWPPARRSALLRFYRSCVQRHLHATRRTECRWLSKNPSFTACMATLRDLFPDARFVFCFRDPAEAIGSQLSSLGPGARLFGHDVSDPDFVGRFVDMYARFAARGSAGEAPPRGRTRFIDLRQLGAGLESTISDLYEGFGWTVTPAFRRTLERKGRAAARYRSRHEYRLEAYGLSAAHVHALMEEDIATLEERSRTGVSA